jgi:hypothetical protein
MKSLYIEIVQRFPEIRSRIFEGDEELPYMLMRHLADWLRDQGEAITPAIVERVVAFARWCESQPSGSGAGDDTLTILVVGFYESLFKLPSTRRLLPRLISRDDRMRNADYLRQWIDDDDYRKALKEYGRNA